MERRRIGKTVVAYVALFTFLCSVVALGETLQAAERDYDRPIVLRYVQMASSLALLPLAMLLFPSSRCSYTAAFVRLLLWPAGAAAILTFGGGLLYTYALRGSTVGITTALTRLKPVFIFGLSVALRMAKFSWWALLATGLSIGGVVLLLIPSFSHDSASGASSEVGQTWWGVVLTVVAAFVWAATDLYVQHVASTRFDNTFSVVVQMTAFQGCTGVWDLVAFWPAVPISALAESRTVLALPPASAMPMIAATCAALVLTNLAISIGIACSSAFFMGIGSLLAIPVAFISDYFLHGTVPNAYGIGGASLVVAAFLVLTLRTPPDLSDGPEHSESGSTDKTAETDFGTSVSALTLPKTGQQGDTGGTGGQVEPVMASEPVRVVLVDVPYTRLELPVQ